jgi:hypothetical protein
VTSVFLDFVRIVVDGDIDKVSRRLAASPALATAASEVGAELIESICENELDGRRMVGK